MNDSFQISLKNVSKSFEDLDVPVLNNLSFEINASERVAILGSSGSGKSTLLHIIAGLDDPSKGNVFFNNDLITKLSDNNKSILRNKHIGFVYQSHHLLKDFSAIENVMMPLIIRRNDSLKDFNQAKKILKKLGLGSRLNHFPHQLSGGERQRVAIARAIVTSPDIILADEPTGNLDHKNANIVFESFLELTEEFKTAIVLVTHDQSLARKMNKIYHLSSGKLKSK
ncbi:ABC transporter ATP-binding protein [Methylophilaceae bacterium]|jgi:lipoprotein-releasing system ATP-binding protein|nr:ABC transporter ATP-binding protein [Nitrosomonadales bacterium]MCH9771263.1 ABC transporter ATP-binding protein [Betaproteobacteria bacterium]MDC1109509.1 ABC transporter ATP-binding protein [Methylophilaceae bacterium]